MNDEQIEQKYNMCISCFFMLDDICTCKINIPSKKSLGEKTLEAELERIRIGVEDLRAKNNGARKITGEK